MINNSITNRSQHGFDVTDVKPGICHLEQKKENRIAQTIQAIQQ